MTVRIGIDTGGTFTDVVCVDVVEGAVHTAKVPSTPPDFDRGVLSGLDEVMARAGVDPGDVSFLSHGTTVGTNAVLEGDLPRLGLITNQGLRDVIEIGDQTRPALYDLQVEKPPVLIPRRRRLGVGGRIDSTGAVVEPLDEAAVRSAVETLAAADVDAIVVSMLFSPLNDGHERQVIELIEAEAPGMAATRSSAVYPEVREYERTVTTVLNEAVRRRTATYLDRLASGVSDRGIEAPLYVMHAGGGVFGIESAKRYALRTVLSGPAAGAVAARETAVRLGFDDAIGLDMGGTSADVSLVEAGEIVRSATGEIADLPITVPQLDITTVGAGGGSVAWVDAGGGIRVGPESAGADPGPICYGRGGDRPTVTDAQVILGRIDPTAIAESAIPADDERLRSAFERELAAPLGLSIEAAAMSVVQVADARMARELRRITVERGRDPANFALVAFGGAGPLHAPALADHVGLGSVVVPRTPGVLSARGLLVADVRMDESAAYRASALDAEALEAQFTELESTVQSRFGAGGFDATDVSIDRTADVRYRGQSYELQIPVPSGAIDENTVETVRDRFDTTHAERYGHAMADEPIEVVTLRVAGTVETPGFDEAPPVGDGAPRGTRRVYFDEGGFIETPVYARSTLAAGTAIDGPAVLGARGSTTLLPPETTATVSDEGAILIAR